MKVKISTRQVYHKIIEHELDIPNIKEEEVDLYLLDNEHLYIDEIDKKLSNTKHDFGLGMDNSDWTDLNSESEWRYDIKDKNYGGHL